MSFLAEMIGTSPTAATATTPASSGSGMMGAVGNAQQSMYSGMDKIAGTNTGTAQNTAGLAQGLDAERQKVQGMVNQGMQQTPQYTQQPQSAQMSLNTQLPTGNFSTLYKQYRGY